MNKSASLTPLQASVLLTQATEAPFSGKYTDNEESGTYLCRLCGLALFSATSQFHSGCGWASFDKAIHGNILERPDNDARRTEIICARCNGHLGHVFDGEGFTPLNTRHCVNSVALDFVKDIKVKDTEEIILAGGCFWGVEYYLQQLPGVLLTEVGYCGGRSNDPVYKDVCTQTTGHVEAVRIIFDIAQLDLETLLKYFFEIHDPTQGDGQGPDIGAQYLSAIFYYTTAQKQIAEAVVRALTAKGYRVTTDIRPMAIFWRGEEYHQGYYLHKGTIPYCHHYTKRF